MPSNMWYRIHLNGYWVGGWGVGLEREMVILLERKIYFLIIILNELFKIFLFI